MDSVNLSGHFLIAMPNMVDPYFAKTLAYICQHNEEGALGVVINRPLDLTLGGLFEQVDIPLTRDDSLGEAPVYFGGPVQMDRGFVLHAPSGEWQSSIVVGEDLALTTSRDILFAIGRGEGPEQLLVTLGYAGWGAGQLEKELAENAWLTVPAQRDIMFRMGNDERLAAAMGMLGVDFASLSEEAGHA